MLTTAKLLAQWMVSHFGVTVNQPAALCNSGCYSYTAVMIMMVHLEFTLLLSPLCCSQKSDSDPVSFFFVTYNSSEKLLACFPLTETRCLKLLKNKPPFKVLKNFWGKKSTSVCSPKIHIH